MSRWFEEDRLKFELGVNSRQILEHKLIGCLLVDLHASKVKHLKFVHGSIYLLILVTAFVLIIF